MTQWSRQAPRFLDILIDDVSSSSTKYVVVAAVSAVVLLMSLDPGRGLARAAGDQAGNSHYWTHQNMLTQQGEFHVNFLQVSPLIYSLSSPLFAHKALAGRRHIQEALGSYYTAKHDLSPGTAEVVQNHAAIVREQARRARTAHGETCHRENPRHISAQVVMRRVIADTVVSDGAETSYLPQAGADVHMAGSTKDGDDEVRKMRRTGYIPFGGGKHLCPGRNFAFAEIVGLTVALVAGYEIRDEDGEVPALPGAAKVEPAHGIRVSEREGAGTAVTQRAGPLGWTMVLHNVKFILFSRKSSGRLYLSPRCDNISEF
ncbi:hypothetical protein B0T25DRAFT_584926 [Lasiosphaeria hispida]|uniref:Cytochrome P450 n=1 Tax=Lasiosphaeria hispida TaxID=260671 RepID=A0AAJ0M9Z9_9PEZI|nr:hypothetical protein B0T25DRAFT_584926 [Lasiosphaeria hispida]